MKKLRLIAMFALTFALVFGAASCKNEEEEGPWGESLAEVLKAEPKLDLSGKWEAFEGDIEVEITGDECSMKKYMEKNLAKMDKMSEKERIELICDDFLGVPTVSDENDNSLAIYLLGLEAESKKDEEKNVNVMINGDRNEVRVEFDETFSEKDGKDTVNITGNGYVTFSITKK